MDQQRASKHRIDESFKTSEFDWIESPFVWTLLLVFINGFFVVLVLAAGAHTFLRPAFSPFIDPPSLAQCFNSAAVFETVFSSYLPYLPPESPMLPAGSSIRKVGLRAIYYSCSVDVN